jgi:hypothetical protein
MPKTDMDYNKIIMYKIVCNDLSIPYTYVGHTTNFIKRKHKHKYSCITQTNQHYNYLLYQTIRENGGWNNWSMIEIEKYPCNDKNEALARERYWIESLKSTLNKVIPTRTYQEWREENKEHIAEYKKGHNEANKEHITEYHKEHYETNKEHLSKKQTIKVRNTTVQSSHLKNGLKTQPLRNYGKRSRKQQITAHASSTM